MIPLPSALWVDLIGLPWRLHGVGPEAYDCYGLLCEVMRRHTGVAPPAMIYGALVEEHQALIAEQLPRWTPCDVGPGAGLLFRRGGSRAGEHVAIAIDDNRFLHASEDLGQVCVSRLHGDIRSYHAFLVGAFRYAV